MPTATLTSKGQVTVPREVRQRLGLTAGSLLDFVPDDTGYRVTARLRSIDDLFAILPAPTGTTTLAEMDAAIAAGASESCGR